VLAVIFGVINAFITPFLQLIGLPITCLTLGLFALVINAAMLALAVWLGDLIGLDVEMDGFIAAFLSALLVWLVSWLLSLFVGTRIRAGRYS
jgi:putative membrane protein